MGTTLNTARGLSPMTEPQTLGQFIKATALEHPYATIYSYACDEEWSISHEEDMDIPRGDFTRYVKIRHSGKKKNDVYIPIDQEDDPSYQIRLYDGPYRVQPIGEKFKVVRSADPDSRPVGETLYDDKSNAHRRKRQLNKDARKIDKMIKEKGAIIL